MLLELFINFDGNCREAAEFYAKVFKSEVTNLMTYADAPSDPNKPGTDIDKSRIIYAGVPIGKTVLMLCDMPTGLPYTPGNNINPTVSLEDKAEVTRIFNDLKIGGQVLMEPQQTFFSELYFMVIDKFGITWQILHYVPQPE